MTSTPPRIAAIGECMIELRHLSESALELAFGGDTLNTAVYLNRAGRARGIRADYATALGDDPYSEAMCALFAREGVGDALIARLAGRLPGLYAIRTDDRGERTFYYWRGEAAARAMFDGASGARLADALAAYDWIYLSGITLSILDVAARARLAETLDRARARGGRVAFDSNYRARGWPGPDAARAALVEMLTRADLALPSFDDERALFDDPEPRATATRLHALGVREVVVKNGAEAALLSTGGGVETIHAEPVRDVVDTTAAGDSFNGGYLAARIAGLDPADAARYAHRLAGAVVRHRGAIIPRDACPPPI